MTTMAEMNSVLIVEDDSFQAHLLKMLLTNLGYPIAGSSKTGEEAVELAVKLKPKLILMDIALAGQIDGIEAIRRINEKSENINVIYITGNSDPLHLKRAEEIGFDDFLTKPISKKILADSLLKVLN